MKNQKDVLYLILIFFLNFLLSFNSFLDLNGFPSGIDTPAHLWKIYYIKENLLSYNRIFMWDPNWYGGYPIFALYPLLSYLIPATFDLIVNNLTLTYNLFRFIFSLISSFLVFVIVKNISRDNLAGLVGGILFLTSYPVFNNTYTIGRFPTSFSISLFLLLTYILIKEKEIYFKFSFKKIVLISTLLSIFILVHPMILFLWCVFISPLCILNLFRYGRKIKFKAISLTFLLIFVCTLLISLPFLLHFYINLNLLYPVWIGINPKVEHLHLFYAGVYGDVYPLYVGIFHLLLFILGIIYSIIHRNTILLIFVVESFFFFLLSLGGLTPLFSFFPFNNQFDVNRFEIFFSVGMSIVAANGIKLLNSRNLRKTFVFGLIFLLFLDIYPALNESKNWRPNFPSIKLDGEYRALGVGLRHWDSFLLPYYFNIKTTNGWFIQADPHRNFTILLSQLEGLWYPYQDFPRLDNFNLFKNLLELSNTKYIIFAWKDWFSEYAKESTVGSYQPNHIYNIKFFEDLSNSSEFELFYSSPTLTIFKFLRNFSYCEAVKPRWISFDYFNEASKILSNSTCIRCELPVEGEEKDMKISSFTNVSCKRVDPYTIEIMTEEPAWVLVKESYYPFWRTKSGEKIYNAFGFMVVYVKGSETLYYREGVV